MSKLIWFKPKRFWKWFACYYPVGWQGMVLTLALLLTGLFLFGAIERKAHSTLDAFLAFSPWGIALLVIYDLLSFRLGEYPSWWRKKEKQ